MSERDSRSERGGMTAVLLACCAVGAITIGATLTLGPQRFMPSRAAVPGVATEEYGKRLLAQTSELLGPDNPDPKRRYSGSRLSCGSCHLGTGMEPGTLALLAVGALATAPRPTRPSSQRPARCARGR